VCGPAGTVNRETVIAEALGTFAAVSYADAEDRTVREAGRSARGRLKRFLELMPEGFFLKKAKEEHSRLRIKNWWKVFIFNEPFRDHAVRKVFQAIGAEYYSRIAVTTCFPPAAEKMLRRGYTLLRAGPISFTEFALELGEEETVRSILESFAAWRADDGLHRKAGGLFADYMAVGGMPEAVERFAQTRNIDEVRAVQKTVWTSWKESVRRDAGPLADAALEALSELVRSLASGACLETAAADKRLEALKWLSEAGYVLEAKHSKGQPKDAAPLPSRWYLADTGVLAAAAEAEGFGAMSASDGGRVGLRRNLAAQVLAASGHPLFYFANETRTVHFDFMVPFYYRPEIKAYWNTILNKRRREDVPAPLPLLAPRIRPSDINSGDFLYIEEKSRNKPAYTAVPLVFDAAFAPDEVHALFRNHEGVHSGPYVLSDGKPEIREDFVRLPFYMAPFISWVPEEFAKEWNSYLDQV
jgi:predicted AAA+ superfamily ATPase